MNLIGLIKDIETSLKYCRKNHVNQKEELVRQEDRVKAGTKEIKDYEELLIKLMAIK